MMEQTAHSPTTRFADWPLALKSILGFWLVYAATVVARALLGSDPLTALQNKLVTLGVGIVLTGLVYLAIATIGGREGSNRRKVIVAGIASFIAACAMAGLLMLADGKMRESKEEFRHQAKEGVIIVEKGNTIRIERTAAEPLVLTLPRMKDIDPAKKFRYAADAAVIWLFFFAAWSAFYLATLAQAQALRAQRRAAAAESAAQTAQVRALRYQVNPHFLFNTLNSLSALVMTGKDAAAEKMIQTLSAFYRRSLAEDPTGDIALEAEVALQRSYLEIEAVRFPERLRPRFDLPEALETACVPGLILQPLVENSVRYAVASTARPVTVAIAAREEAGQLVLEVSDDGPAGPDAGEHGFGIGLANVRDRLAARYGDAASLVSGPVAAGGWRSVIRLPLEIDD